MGLVLARDPEGLKAVERLYWEVHSKVSRNKDLEKMHSYLIDAMAARDLIADIGIEKDLGERVGSDVMWETCTDISTNTDEAVPPTQPADAKPTEPPWGEAVEGVQVRLRADKDALAGRREADAQG